MQATNNGVFHIKGLEGKKELNGVFNVRGAKNAALKLMSSSFLFDDGIALTNMPDIEDVHRLSEIIEVLGGKVDESVVGEIHINATDCTTGEFPRELAKRLRASIVLTGPVLSRCGKISFPHPGGCVIGARPIDFFLEGFKRMGATISHEDEYTVIEAKNGLKGAELFTLVPSVTFTENFMMAAVLAEGTTVIRNAALEPEIIDLAEFLNKCGANISGAGSPTIKIVGGSKLSAKGSAHRVLPDRIEAGSILILGALSADNMTIADCVPEHLMSPIELLKSAGVPIEVGTDSVSIVNNASIPWGAFKSVNLKTHEYPGFPTDIQAPMSVFLTQATGQAIVFETIFEGRLNYSDDLIKMGADIKQWDAHRMSINGPTMLKGRELAGPDIRAGLAFLIAGLIAKGDSVISNAYLIDRGYEDIEGRLTKLGAKITREK